jgi:hypothetical protein
LLDERQCLSPGPADPAADGRDAHDQEEGCQQPPKEWAEDIASQGEDIPLLGQGIVQDGGDSRRVDQPVQALPVPAHGPFEVIEGGDGQGDQQEGGSHPDPQIELAEDQAEDLGPEEGIIHAQEPEDVQAGIEESVQSGRPAAVGQLAPAGEGVEGGHGQGAHQPVDGDAAEPLLDVLDGIDGQSVGGEIEEQEGQGQPAEEMDGDAQPGERGFSLHVSNSPSGPCRCRGKRLRRNSR